MKKIIITGQTGSGKTYNTINSAKEIGTFAYIAPCRQLAYEVYIDYAEFKKDTLATGEVFIKGNRNFYGVYESLQKNNIKNFDSVIIDEAHYLTDVDRGGHINELIAQCNKDKVNVFLVTATRNFPIWRGWQLIELQSSFTPPKKVKISYFEFFQRKMAGVPTIEFVKYKSDAMLSADTLPSERLKLQLDYRAGKIKYVSSTNVLAQGINMPCENVLIEYNSYDDNEVLTQKLGRLGRLGFTQSNEVTYCITELPKKIKKNRTKVKLTKKIITTTKEWGSIDHISHEVPNFATKYSCSTGKYAEYKEIRYCKNFFKKALTSNLDKEKLDIAKNCLNILKTEEENVKNIIINQMKNIT